MPLHVLPLKSTRLRIELAVLAALVAFIAFAVWFVAAMPGERHRGPLPPLGSEDRRLAENLKAHVVQKAIALDRDAALQSASWGVGQVMGFNHAIAGFSSVTAMVDAMVRDENAQLLAVASFIKNTKLSSALQRQDWRAFAAGYNGADFAKNHYDTKLAEAHVEYKKALPNVALRVAQAALTYLSFNPGPVDGVIGQRTRAALTAYQQRAGLPQTGALDAATESKLLAEAFGA